MRRIRIGAVIATLVALAIVAIGGTTGTAASKEPVVIGFAVAKSGWMSAFDIPGYNAWRVAIANQNKKGGLLGRKITTVIVDTKSDINQSAIAGQAVLSKGADFMVVSAGYDVGGGAARVANTRKVLSQSIAAGDPRMGRQGIGPYAFTPNYAVPTEGAAVAEFARARGWKNAYLLVDISTGGADYTKGLCGYFKKRWKMYGSATRIAGEDTFTVADTSIATQISRLKSTSNVDFVFVCSYPPGGASAIKQIRESGIKLPLVGGDTFDGTYWTKGITKLSNFYAPVAANVHTADPRPSITKFVKEYRALVGVRPLNSLAVFAHQGAEVYFRAVQKAGTLNSDKVLKVLETSKNVPTIAGPFTFTRRDHFNTTGTVTFIEYQNGKLRFKALVKPKVVPPVDY